MLQRCFVLALLLALVASSCSLYRAYEDSKPEAIRQTESMLSDAGFRTIKIDTDDQIGLVEDLPRYELRKYPTSSGSVFWYYDPKICSCVYEGHQDEYDRYQMLVRQQNDTAQYAAELQDEDVTSLNALNGAFFPPPIIVAGGFFGGHYLGGGHGFGHIGAGGGGHGHR